MYSNLQKSPIIRSIIPNQPFEGPFFIAPFAPLLRLDGATHDASDDVLTTAMAVPHA